MKFRKYLQPMNFLAYKLLPPMTYVKLAEIFIPLFDKKRRNSGVKFSKKDDVFIVEMRGGEYVFNSQFKVGRFLFPEEEFGLLVLNRYSDEDIFVEDGDVVIDIGANIGEFSVASARVARKVLAIEPDRSAYRCVVENTENLDNVVCRDVAVSECDGEFDFYMSPGTSDSSLLKPRVDSQLVTKVKGQTLLSIMRDHEISIVDFLKLEAEGYEPEILEGAGSALRSVRKIAIDASPERYGEPTYERCMEVLLAKGFSVWRKGWIVFGRNNDVVPIENI